MSSYWDHLAKNNDHPTDSTIFEVRKLLSESLKQLEDIKLEIKRLEAKQLEIEEYIQRFHRILAPIRRVPQDILCTIFEHCLPTHRNPTMAVNETPMLLTRVCSIWRSIALKSPRLWSQIHVPFRDVRHDRDPPVVVSILQNRCYAVQEWLSRSGDLPLSISVNYQQDSPWILFVTGNLNARSIGNLSKMLLETLLLFSPRWRSLEIVSSDNVHHELETMLSTHTLPLLLRLRIQIISWKQINDHLIPSPKNLLRAPNLKYLSFHGSKHKITHYLSPTHIAQSLAWYNIGITHVSLSRCGLETCITLFKGYPRLIQCDLAAEDDHLEIENEVIIPNNIHLPQLRSLWIKTGGNVGPDNFVPALFNVLDCPQLQNVGYYNNSRSLNAISGTITSAVTDEIPLAFFHRIINLTSLELDRFFLRPSNILDILKSQHRLTRLCLTCRYGMTPRDSSSLEMETFDLEALVIRRETDGELTPSSSTSTQLLPCLEVFELHKTLVTDALVLLFVSSRMNPKSDIAVLKKVKIFFDRLEEGNGLDLAEEIRSRAYRKAIQIDTKFCYVQWTHALEIDRNDVLHTFIEPLRGQSGDDPTWPHEEDFDSEYDD